MHRGRAIIIMTAICLLGAIYGFVSAIKNRNPHHWTTIAAWHWQPSALWFPSYALCHWPPNGYGIEHTRSGYLFRSKRDENRYIRASTALGLCSGFVVSLAGLTWRRYSQRPRSMS